MIIGQPLSSVSLWRQGFPLKRGVVLVSQELNQQACHSKASSRTAVAAPAAAVKPTVAAGPNMAGPGAQNGALSSIELQSHYDEVEAQMPVLPLSILPRSLANSLAAVNTDPTLARLARKAAAGLTECQVCSCSSQPEQLQLLLPTRLEFHSRAVHITAARFVCAQCAAVSSCSTLMQLLTPPVGAEADEQRYVPQ